MPKLYTTRPIKAGKKTDLLSLFDYIPPVYHAFYNNLLSTPGRNDAPELSDGEDSDQEEDEREESDGDSEQELESDELSESD